MNPGRELDALIAEKVMGYKVENTAEGYFLKGQLGNYSWHNTVLRYSTDISAAWEVVEHFNELGWDISVVGSGELKSSDSWHVEFEPRYVGGETNGVIIEGGFSAPLAICLAALKAIK